MTVRFTLPSEVRASLELLDVSGRIIAVREVGMFGAGSHAIDIAVGGSIRPGIYFVRLTLSRNARMKRVAVLD